MNYKNGKELIKKLQKQISKTITKKMKKHTYIRVVLQCRIIIFSTANHIPQLVVNVIIHEF